MFSMRHTSRLICLTLLMGAVASASADNLIQPFGPSEFEHDAQPFAFADLSDFALGDKTRQGFNFTYERVHWAIIQPPRSIVGDPGRTMTTIAPDGASTTVQTSAITTAVDGSGFTWGNRFDLGYVDGNTGWTVGVTGLHDQVQQNVKFNAAVVFRPDLSGTYGNTLAGFIDSAGDGVDDDLDADGIFGRFTFLPIPAVFVLGGVGTPDVAGGTSGMGDLVIFPTQFDRLAIRNITRSSSVEVMRMFRLRQLPSNSTAEFSMGVRYQEIQDLFQVNAIGGFRSVLPMADLSDAARSFWDTEVDNNMIGPQVAGRWYARRGAWNFAVDGRFFSAWNFQSVQQRGQLGQGLLTGLDADGNLPANQPAAFDTSEFENSRRFREWSPTAELRLETSYQLTKAVALKIGWTGNYSAGIGRASNLVSYTLPKLGINSSNRSDYISHGVNFGVEVNR